MFVISQAVREWYLLDSSVSLVRRLTRHSSVVVVAIHGKHMFRLYQDELDIRVVRNCRIIKDTLVGVFCYILIFSRIKDKMDVSVNEIPRTTMDNASLDTEFEKQNKCITL